MRPFGFVSSKNACSRGFILSTWSSIALIFLSHNARVPQNWSGIHTAFPSFAGASLRSSQKSKQGTHKKEASGPSGISSQETHIKKKQKERKKERLNLNQQQQQHRTPPSSMKVVFQVVDFSSPCD
jgi:hypothetical protein